MALSPDQVTIAELTVLDARYWWRIDWLGDVYNQRSHHAQHMIEIFLSPVHSDSKGVIVSPYSANSAAQRKIELGVGYLPMLHIGAVFQAGKLVPLRPEWVTRVRVRISPVTSTPISLANRISRFLSLGEQPEPILPSEFKIGPRAWPGAASSHILATGDPSYSDPYYVMIPSIELARFFFCSSSVLARSLFAHGWEDLIWREKCDVSQMPKQITVGLKTVKGLRNPDAHHLAYKLLSPYAEQEINAIRQSLQSTNSANPRRQPISCAFPFIDDVDIEAEVIRIRTGTALKERYFVTRLVSCERPIPFDICSVHPMLHPGQGDNWDSADLKPLAMGGKPDPQAATDASGRGRVFGNLGEIEQQGHLSDEGGNPASTDEAINIVVNEMRFPGLSSVPTPLSRKEVQQYKSAPGNRPVKVDGEGASTGTPAGSKPIVPANIRTDLAARLDQTVAWLIDAAPVLREAGYEVGDEIAKGLDIFAEDQDRLRSWAKISYESSDGKIFARSRLLVALPIILGNEIAIVAEIERRPAEQFGMAIFFIPSIVSTPLFLDELVEEIANRKGWPLYDHDKKRYSLNEGNSSFEGDRGFHSFVNDKNDLALKIRTLLARRIGG